MSPTFPVRLTASTVAHLARLAFNEGRLQAQTIANPSRSQSCRYSGPCAIGVAIDPIIRPMLDANSQGAAIATLLKHDRVVTPNHHHDRALQVLQARHDEAVLGIGSLGDLDGQIDRTLHAFPFRYPDHPDLAEACRLNDDFYWGQTT
jgi:hypothetical protein